MICGVIMPSISEDLTESIKLDAANTPRTGKLAVQSLTPRLPHTPVHELAVLQAQLLTLARLGSLKGSRVT